MTRRTSIASRASDLDLSHVLSMSTSLPGLDEADRRLLAAIQDGLPLVSRPFAEIGARLDLSESEVMARLQQLQTRRVIRRFGVVVRHHEVGYGANAMVVWDVPDEQVRELGRCLAEFDFITLCYRRPRHLPQWRYNLYCMIHGKTREDVLSNLEWMVNRCGLHGLTHEVLFSLRRFKQRGAMYFDVQGSTNADAVVAPDILGNCSLRCSTSSIPGVVSSATFAHPCASQDARLASAAEPQAAGTAGEG